MAKKHTFKVGEKVRVINHGYRNISDTGIIKEKIGGRACYVEVMDYEAGQLSTYCFFNKEMAPLDEPSRKPSKGRVTYSDSLKHEALAAWDENLKQDKRKPKAAIARKYGINPNTFNMWTHEVNNPQPNVHDYYPQDSTEDISLLRQIRDELKALNKTLSKRRIF